MQQFYNPYMTPQQRLNYMEQQYPQFGQLTMPQNQELITIPVTNIDEANAFRVNPNGTPTFFYNAGANEVYLKKTNRETGRADFQVFRIIQPIHEQSKQTTETINFEKELRILNEKMDGLYSLFVNAHPIAEVEQNETTNSKGGKNAK